MAVQSRHDGVSHPPLENRSMFEGQDQFPNIRVAFQCNLLRLVEFFQRLKPVWADSQSINSA